MSLTDYMSGAGKEFTNPGLDLKDFTVPASPPHLTASSTSCPTSSLPICTGSGPICLTAKDLKDKFKAKYGYDLGVP